MTITGRELLAGAAAAPSVKTVKALRKAARDLAAARVKLDAAKSAAEQAALAALADGVTEVDVARTLGVNRMTVRKWAGK